MIKNEKVSAVPKEILPILTEMAREGMQAWMRVSGLIFRMSSEVRCVYEDDVPLLVIGAFRPTLVSQTQEVWMIASTELKARHLREGRKWFLEWAALQPGRIICRVTSQEAARFAKFFKFSLVEWDKDAMVFEVQL